MDNADIQEACVSPFPALGCMAAESRFSAATGAESRDPDVVFIRTAQMDPDPFKATVLLTAEEPTSAMHDAGKGVTGTMAAAKPDLWDPEGLVSLRVPANCRVVLAWLGSSAESHAILKHCQGLRRLYVFENNPERLAFLRGRPDVQVLLRDPGQGRLEGFGAQHDLSRVVGVGRKADESVGVIGEDHLLVRDCTG